MLLRVLIKSSYTRTHGILIKVTSDLIRSILIALLRLWLLISHAITSSTSRYTVSWIHLRQVEWINKSIFWLVNRQDQRFRLWRKFWRQKCYLCKRVINASVSNRCVDWHSRQKAPFAHLITSLLVTNQPHFSTSCITNYITKWQWKFNGFL